MRFLFLVVDRLYVAPFSAFEQTRCALVVCDSNDDDDDDDDVGLNVLGCRADILGTNCESDELLVGTIAT